MAALNIAASAAPLAPLLTAAPPIAISATAHGYRRRTHSAPTVGTVIAASSTSSGVEVAVRSAQTPPTPIPSAPRNRTMSTIQSRSERFRSTPSLSPRSA